VRGHVGRPHGRLGSGPHRRPLILRRPAAYSRLIAEVADAHELVYLPLYERKVEQIRQAGARPIAYREASHPVFNGTVLQRFVLRRSLDAISRRRGLFLTTDHVHQTSRGADTVAEVIEGSGLLTRATGRADRDR
jgi:hypothetical protein